MSNEGRNWWHVIISTYKSWLPGDPRGFRSRKHKIHSSGDYKNPPPEGEHHLLHDYHRDKVGEAVVIPPEQWATVGQAILEKLTKLNYRVLAISVAATHSHWLVELPEDDAKVRQIVGQCKTKSSHAIREQVPGRVWASRGKFIRIVDREHQLNTYRYVRGQKAAWIWDFRKEENNDDQAQE